MFSYLGRANKGKESAKFFVPDNFQTSKIENDRKAVGVSEIELSFLDSYGTFDENVNTKDLPDIHIILERKIKRKVLYKEMSYFHIINEVINAVSNESIIENVEGDIIEALLKKKDDIPKAIQKKLEDNANHVFHDVFDLSKNGWQLFKKWLIEGELFTELVIDKARKGISTYRVLPSATTIPIFEGSTIVGYKQYPLTTNGNAVVTSNDGIELDLNRVCYSCYGEYGKNPIDTLGYLEPAIRPYHHLKGLEDSLITYRITRSPERRVWNVGVGMMSKGKVGEYMSRLINKFRRQVHYNASTGEINSNAQIQSVMDDIWLPKNQGEGTDVSTIGGSIEINKIDDVLLQIRNLYRTMQYPRSRWSDESGGSETYNLMKPDTIQRDEVNLNHFVNRARKSFGQIFLQAWMQQNRLTMSKNELVYNNPIFLGIKFSEDNLFELQKRMDLNESRMNALATASSFIKSPMNEEGLFSKEFVLKKFFMMDTEDYDENETLLKKESADMVLDGDNETGDGDFDEY